MRRDAARCGAMRRDAARCGAIRKGAIAANVDDGFCRALKRQLA
jgi:hypothetical protein